MSKTFTKDDAVSYLYGETQKELTQEINIARLEDPSLDSELDAFDQLIDQIDHFVVKAPARIVDRIMEYSRNGSLESV